MSLWNPPLRGAALCVAVIAGLSATWAVRAAPPPGSGIDRQYVDVGVRAQDDFFRHVNGQWLKNTPIPPDRAGVGAFEQIHESIQPQLLALIEDAARNAADADARRIGDLYASFMDEARLETLGATPLAAELAAIDAVHDRAGLVALTAHLTRLGVAMPLGPYVHQDAKDSTRYIIDFAQGGLGLPERQYYLDAKDKRLAGIRQQYEGYLKQLLTLGGERDPAAGARAVLALETELARVQWTPVQNRDPVKIYNRYELAKLRTLAPGVDWDRYLEGIGIAGKVGDVIVSQPSYVGGYARLLQSQPLETWKLYAKLRLLNGYAPYLSKSFVDTRFAFAGTALRGTPENLPRWKRGVTLVEGALGESLGKLYVARHFPPEHKARMDTLVANLLRAYRQSIDTLDWMSPATKKEAQAKLAKFTPKIGYPNKWRDYAGLVIRRDDLVGNVMRSNAFDFDFQTAKLGKPIDRDEWLITPQTVNAYYNAELNEIVFPAAILQPPFFDAAADDAVNYGGIGAVIGHEISHGFDDEGSQYDGDGHLRDWWTAADRKRFSAKTRQLVAQYGAYSPVPGYRVDGQLTLGENIADNSGLAIAYKAWKLSLEGKPAPVIDGLSGDVRFFYGFAQIWRGKTRDAAMIEQIKRDPHAPDEFRTNGSVRNLGSFHDSFGTKPGDPMYLPPGKRVTIW